MKRAAATTPDFTNAERQFATLNERQRAVLRLIAEGRTNPAIAEVLGMTLDGAKWNVSEILSKLGLASREEAAAYYRWRRHPAPRMGRLSRAVGSVAGIKWVAAGLAGLAAVVAIAVGFGLSRGDSNPGPLVAPFELEATITVVDRSATAGTSIPPDPVEARSTLSWSYQSNERFRYRISAPNGDFESVADGHDLWMLDRETLTYARVPLPAGLSAGVIPYPAISVVVGPLPGGSVQALMAQLGEGRVDGFAYERIGSDTLLGRTVAVYEFRPVGQVSSSDGGQRGEGYGRVWVDEDEGVVLRYLVESEIQSADAVVTRYEARPVFGDGSFEFQPPAGATESR